MSKKGQTTVFFIAGILLLVAFGLIPMFMSESVRQTQIVGNEFSEVTVFVESCITQTVEEGIELLGRQGGYYKPQDSYAFESVSVPLYLDRGQFQVPTLSVIERELGVYIEENLPACIDNFQEISSLGYAIEESSPDAEPKILENGITAFVTYPLSVNKGSTRREIEQFSVTVPFDFRDLYSIIQRIMLEQGEDVLAVHYGFLAESAYNNDYFFEITQIDEDTVIYSIRFDSALLQNEPYVFNFAADYDW